MRTQKPIKKESRSMPSQKLPTVSATLVPPVGPRDHVQGPATAAVTLVEYGDCQCPYCHDARPIVKELQKHFGEQLRFVFRHFPLGKMHAFAERAAEAAEAASSQGKFWEMLDYLYDHQESLDATGVAQAATVLRLDRVKFSREVAEKVHAARVRKDIESGIRSGVSGTPTLFINGMRNDDDNDVRTLKVKIEEALQRVKPLGARRKRRDA